MHLSLSLSPPSLPPSLSVYTNGIFRNKDEMLQKIKNADLGFNKNRLTKIIKFLSDKMIDTYYHEITSFKY